MSSRPRIEHRMYLTKSGGLRHGDCDAHGAAGVHGGAARTAADAVPGGERARERSARGSGHAEVLDELQDAATLEVRNAHQPLCSRKKHSLIALFPALRRARRVKRCGDFHSNVVPHRSVKLCFIIRAPTTALQI